MNIESVLKSHGFGGRYGSGDRLPPPPVTNLKQVSSNGRVELSWTNPVDTDFAGLIIVRSQEGYPKNRFDGVQIFDGVAESYSDAGLTNYQDYYYRIFTYDYDQNYNDDLSQRIKGRPEETYIYGITINLTDSNPDTAVQYTHDAEYFNPGAASWQNTWLFRGIRPVLLNSEGEVVAELDRNDFSKDINGNPVVLFGGHNVMIEFPKFYTAVERKGDLVNITVSRKKLHLKYDAVGFLRDIMQVVREDKDAKTTEFYTPEADAFYLGAYQSTFYNNKLGSWSWSYDKIEELSSINHDFRFMKTRELTRANGRGYGIMHFQHYQVVALLYLFWFKSLDSVSKLGYGRSIPSASPSSSTGTLPGVVPGSLNQRGMTVASIGKGQNKLFGMEGFWSNTWIDGLFAKGYDNYYSENGLNHCWYQVGTHYDDTNYMAFMPAGEVFEGFVSSMKLEKTGLLFLPKHVDGSSTTYYCDYVTWRLRKNPNTWDYDVLDTRRASLSSGIFGVNLYRFDYIEALDEEIGYPKSRLCYVPEYKIPNYTVTTKFIGGGQYEWTLNTY